jgi:hypothetical protein
MLSWTKKNWPVIVSGVVILGSLPTAWHFSNAWNAKIKKSATDEGTRALSGTKVSVNYVVSSPTPGSQDYTLNDAPNDQLTRWFVEIKNELSRQTKAVLDRVTAFNKGVGPDAAAVGRTPHAVLVPELFPGPTSAQILQTAFPGKDAATIQGMSAEVRDPALAKALRDLTEPALRQMEDKLLGRRDNPDPFEGLLRAANAGAPPSPADVLLAVQDRLTREREKRTQTVVRELTPAEQAELATIAQATRLGRYQGVSKAFSVYMTKAALGAPIATNQQGSAQASGQRVIPTEALFRSNPRLGNDKDLFLFQWDQWIMADLIAAIRLANTDQGKPTGVENSVVKRVDRLAAMSFSPFEGEATSNTDSSSGFGSQAPASAAPGAEVKPDYQVSLTGRATSRANPDYDVRNAMIIAIVSSERLPVFLDAISRSNFNTVLQVQLSQVDVKEDLDKGYYYGNEHVVRATIIVETVWLRHWTGPLMPSSVKAALGVPEPTPEAK